MVRILLVLAALCLLAVPALAEFKCNEVKWGGNGKADFIKKVENVGDGDACAKLCGETPECSTYKYCYLSGNNVCTNHYTRGGPDTPYKTCELYKGKFTPAVDDGTYGGFILGLECSGNASPEIKPMPMPTVVPIDKVELSGSSFKNLKGDLLRRITDTDFGKCMEECKRTPECAGGNYCSGLQPSPRPEPVCSGDVRRGVCDLKKFEPVGEPSYWDDTTAQEGDGWMSFFKKAPAATEKQPR